MIKVIKLSNILIITTLSLVNVSVFAHANNAAYNMETRQLDINQQRAAFGLSENDYNNTEGSPYAHEEFLLGKIFQYNKFVYSHVLHRDTIFSNEIEIKKSAGT